MKNLIVDYKTFIKDNLLNDSKEQDDRYKSGNLKSLEQTKQFDGFENKVVKVIIKTKDNPTLFDLYIEKLEAVNPMQVQVVQDHLHLDLEDDEDIIDEAEDKLTILNNYVDNLEIKNEKVDLQSLLRALYDEALQVS